MPPSSSRVTWDGWVGVSCTPQAGHSNRACARVLGFVSSLGAMCQHGLQQICFPRVSEKEKHHEGERGLVRSAEDEAGE